MFRIGGEDALSLWMLASSPRNSGTKSARVLPSVVCTQRVLVRSLNISSWELNEVSMHPIRLDFALARGFLITSK